MIRHMLWPAGYSAAGRRAGSPRGLLPRNGGVRPSAGIPRADSEGRARTVERSEPRPGSGNHRAIGVADRPPPSDRCSRGDRHGAAQPDRRPLSAGHEVGWIAAHPDHGGRGLGRVITAAARHPSGRHRGLVCLPAYGRLPVTRAQGVAAARFRPPPVGRRHGGALAHCARPAGLTVRAGHLARRGSTTLVSVGRRLRPRSPTG